jgi:hypothetical protein
MSQKKAKHLRKLLRDGNVLESGGNGARKRLLMKRLDPNPEAGVMNPLGALEPLKKFRGGAQNHPGSPRALYQRAKKKLG